MKIFFSKEQYMSLLKIVFLGDWMINAVRLPGDIIKKYEDMKDYIFNHAKDFDITYWGEIDPEKKSRTLEDYLWTDEEIDSYKTDYDEEVFWQELFYKLVERDMIKKYGEDVYFDMDYKEKIEKEEEFREKWDNEIEKYGLNRLDVK